MRTNIDSSLIVEEGVLMPFLRERSEPFVLDVVKTHDSERVHGPVIEMYLHVGTHIDAPLHFIRGGDTIDRLLPDRLVGDGGLVRAGTAKAAPFTPPGWRLTRRRPRGKKGAGSGGAAHAVR